MTRFALTFCAAVALYVGAGVAHGLAHPPGKIDRCPTFETCWTMELWCDHHVTRGQLYACRAWVRTQCMTRAERCRGGWSR